VRFLIPSDGFSQRGEIKGSRPDVQPSQAAWKALAKAKHGGMFPVVVGFRCHGFQSVFVNNQPSFTTELAQMHTA
jgi:hypothetical protein